MATFILFLVFCLYGVYGELPRVGEQCPGGGWTVPLRRSTVSGPGRRGGGQGQVREVPGRRCIQQGPDQASRREPGLPGELNIENN